VGERVCSTREALQSRLGGRRAYPGSSSAVSLENRHRIVTLVTLLAHADRTRVLDTRGSPRELSALEHEAQHGLVGLAACRDHVTARPDRDLGIREMIGELLAEVTRDGVALTPNVK
jgi:hypothetical protein